MVESTALEMRRTGNRTVGSNPTLSASPRPPVPDQEGHPQAAPPRLHNLVPRVAPRRPAIPAARPVSGRRSGSFLSAPQHFARVPGEEMNPYIKQVLNFFRRFGAMSRMSAPAQDVTITSSYYCCPGIL